MAKVKKIKIQNLKAVSEVEMEFNGCSAIITAGNNKGKSSILKSLPERLLGKKVKILKDNEKEGFAEWELTTGEKFIWEFKEGGKEKLSFITDKSIKMPLTKEISKIYFPESFDIDKFLHSSPQNQRRQLEQIAGIDMSEINDRYKQAYEDRTFINRSLKESKARLHSFDEKLGVTLLDEEIESVNNEISQVDVFNERINGVKSRLNLKMQDKERSEKTIKDIGDQILALQDKMTNEKMLLEELESDIKKGAQWLGDEKNKEKTKEPLLAKKQDLIEKNTLIKENILAEKTIKEYESLETEAAEKDALVKEIESEKVNLIKNSKLPSGFEFSDEGITYNGFEFNKETLSSSAIYIGALKLASLGLGEVKTMHFDASYLDKNSLSDIEKWAKENDLQLLIERPDFDGGDIVYEVTE